MNKQHKLLILVKSIDGGTGTYVFQLLKLEESINNSIIKVIILEKPSFRKIDKYSDRFIFYHDKNFYPQVYKLYLKNILNFVNEIFWLRTQINQFNPNIIISVDIHCNLLSIINKLIFFSEIKTVCTAHINLIDTLQTKSSGLAYQILKTLVSILYNYSDTLVSTSGNLSINLKKKFNINKKIIVIYHGLKDRSEKIKLSQKNNTIISTGRLVEQKDFLTLIKAFNLIHKDLPKTKLLIIGDGPMKNQIADSVEKLNLSKNIKLLDWKNNIYPYLKKSDIFVLSSKREGFSYVLIEAMAYGLPVISTDTPYGPAEVLDNGRYGILVPMKDPKAMAKAIYELLTDEKKYNYYSQKSLERAKYFSLDKMLNAYKRIILDVINKP